MPPNALSLALAASIYPPAVAAVIALGRGNDVRLRVVLLVGAALLTVFATGALMLLAFDELPVSGSRHQSTSGGLQVVIGLVLLLLAARLRRGRADRSSGPDPAESDPHPHSSAAGSSKTDRYLESRRLVVVLGFILYVVPSPIYIAAIKAIADANASTATSLVYLAIVVVVMLWMIEVPMLMLLVLPGRSAAALERLNQWFARHGRALGELAAAGAGLYLIGAGLVELFS